MGSTKVTLRKREYPSGKVSLYLDFYPAIKNPRTGEESRREYLGIYIMKSPRTAQERRINATKLKQAEAIRAQRELSLINEQYGFIDKSKAKMDAVEYFYSLMLTKGPKWLGAYDHFNKFVHGKCAFKDLNVELCNGFREYLLTAKRLNSKKLQISQNSASGYWSTFRAFLASAYKEGYLKENINDNLDKIELKETRREYLTMDELRRLYNTPCEFPVLREASLFSCLTGLRFDLLDGRLGRRCFLLGFSGRGTAGRGHDRYDDQGKNGQKGNKAFRMDQLQSPFSPPVRPPLRTAAGGRPSGLPVAVIAAVSTALIISAPASCKIIPWAHNDHFLLLTGPLILRAPVRKTMALTRGVYITNDLKVFRKMLSLSGRRACL